MKILRFLYKAIAVTVALAFVGYLATSFFTTQALVGTDLFRASLSSGEVEGDGSSTFPDVSDDGRYIVFTSNATNLVAGDTNSRSDIFMRDTTLGTTERISVDSDENEADHNSAYADITPDGRYVVFESFATDLVAGDTNGRYDIFLRDTTLGTTEIISKNTAGDLGNYNSQRPSVSDDGRYVVFQSASTNLDASDSNTKNDIFLRDRTLGTTVIVSVDSDENHSTSGPSSNARISSDGQYVVFDSANSALVEGDSNAAYDVFVRDLSAGTTEMISLDTADGSSDGASNVPDISSDGRYVVFASVATDLVVGDSNGVQDVFVRDRTLGTTERISVDSDEVEGDALSANYRSGISGDGRYVIFESTATNLVDGDVNAVGDVFLRDRTLGTTVLLSTDSGGVQSSSFVTSPAISSDGEHVAFSTSATNLVAGDTNATSDIFYLGLPAEESVSSSDDGMSYVEPPVCSFGSDVYKVEEGGSVELSWSAQWSGDTQSTFYYKLSDNLPGVAGYEHTYPQGVKGVQITKIDKDISFELAAINVWGASICNLDIRLIEETPEVLEQAEFENPLPEEPENNIEPEETVSLTADECPVYLNEYIKLGENNNPEEVMKLEEFLNIHEKELLEVNGVYEEVDFDAVVRFQEGYREDVLDTWKVIQEGDQYVYVPNHRNGFFRKLAKGTGYVYISTQKKINELYCENIYQATVLEPLEEVEEIEEPEVLEENLAASASKAPFLKVVIEFLKGIFAN